MKTEAYETCSVESINANNETKSIYDKAIEWYDLVWKNEGCTELPKCKRPIYKIDIQTEDYGGTNALVTVQLESPNVLNIVDSYAYDLQSLVGEVGGTLGLFLGLSSYSLVEFVAFVIERLFKFE